MQTPINIIKGDIYTTHILNFNKKLTLNLPLSDKDHITLFLPVLILQNEIKDKKVFFYMN